jgi:lipopolysaccharide transport system ATP-binding protein
MSYDVDIEERERDRLTPAVEPSVELIGINKVFPATGMSLLDLFRSVPDRGFQALTHVSLEIFPGETVGFLGANGAGKSTLLQVIVGTQTPSSGIVRVRGKISALLELGAGFNPEWTGRRNSEFYSMIQGATQDDLPALLRSIEEFADIGAFFERPMRTYSSGMFLRVAFAAAIAVEPDIVIVDEALAVGDARFQNKCFNKFKQLKQAGKTIILVTHDPVMVSQFCTRGIVLKAGRVIVDGSPDEAVSAYRQILYGGDQTSAPAVDVVEKPRPKLVKRPASETDDARKAAHEEALRGAFVWPSDHSRLRQRGHYNPHETVAGSAIGQIADIQLLDDQFQPCSAMISSHTRLKVAVQFAATRDIVKPQFGIVVKSKDNVLLFSVSDIMLKQPNHSIEAGEAFVACFEVDIRLARGDYFIDIGLAEAAGSELVVLEWRMSVCHFTVDNPGEMFGVVDMEASFIRC